MAQQAKVPSAKPEDLSYVSQPTRWKEKVELCALGAHAPAGHGWYGERQEGREAGRQALRRSSATPGWFSYNILVS